MDARGATLHVADIAPGGEATGGHAVVLPPQPGLRPRQRGGRHGGDGGAGRPGGGGRRGPGVSAARVPAAAVRVGVAFCSAAPFILTEELLEL